MHNFSVLHTLIRSFHHELKLLQIVIQSWVNFLFFNDQYLSGIPIPCNNSQSSIISLFFTHSLGTLGARRMNWRLLIFRAPRTVMNEWSLPECQIAHLRKLSEHLSVLYYLRESGGDIGSYEWNKYLICAEELGSSSCWQNVQDSTGRAVFSKNCFWLKW